MRIDEEIQSKFESNIHRALINIMYTASYINGINNKTFKQHGITGHQYNVLRIVNGQSPKPASIQLINERMIDPSSNGSRIVDKLVQKQLVTRVVCPKDRRQVEITITKKAQQLIEDVKEDLKLKITGLDAIPAENLEALNNTLDLIRTTTKNNLK